jgi:hypothetical protein
LEDWADFAHYRLPDPEEGLVQEGGGIDPWDAIGERIDRARSMDDIVVGGMPHGFFFQRLYYLRGFENLMVDFARNAGRLEKLIEMLTDYNLALVERFIRLKVDMVSFGDDLGLQDRMPISDKTFRRFIYPSYRKIF